MPRISVRGPALFERLIGGDDISNQLSVISYQ